MNISQSENFPPNPGAERQVENDPLIVQTSDHRLRNVTEAMERLLYQSGYRLVRVAMLGQGKILQIMAERLVDQNMDFEDCVKLTRDISAWLDVEDPFPHSYRLEVSSPGLDRPLTRRGDFIRHEGEEARLRLVKEAERRQIHGVLAGFDSEQDAIKISPVSDERGEGAEKEFLYIPVAQLSHAHLVITEDVLQRAQARNSTDQE